MKRFAERVGVSGALFVAAALVACFLPLLDVLGYEFAALVGALVSLVGIPRVVARVGPLRSAAVVGSDPGSCRWKLAAVQARDLAALVAVAGLLSLLNMVRVRNCEPGVGLAYLVVFGFGAIPMAVATGLVAAHARAAWQRYTLVFALLVASFASTLATLALQPPIVAYDTYFGYYAGSIYDESLIGFRGHLLFRVWSFGWAALVLALVEFRRSAKRRDARIALGATLVVAALFAWRGDLGLERDRAYVIEALGGHVETEHFDIYYEAAAFDDRELTLLVSDHEARYAELAEFWELEPEGVSGGRLRSFVYGSRETKGALMGGRSTLVAKIWLGEMHITWDGIGDELLAHEMAHLFLRDDGNGPLKLASANGLIPIMALVEGAATAAAWGAGELDYHHWSAAIYRLELGEDISDLLGPAGFWGRYSRRAYTLTGSFARWLIDTHGPATFRAAYTRGDFEGAYGSSLEALVAEWRAFLDAIELTDEQLEVARFRYDRPSLFGRLCARSIATRFEEGDAYRVAGDDQAAARCYETILDDDPTNVSYRQRIAERYAAMGDTRAARHHASQIVEADGAGRARKVRAMELLADLDWASGDVGSAREAYAALADELGTEGDLRRVLAKLHAVSAEAGPLTERAVRRYLATRPSPPAATVSTELLWAATREQSGLAAYLAILRLDTDTPSGVLPELAATIDRAALHPAQRRRLALALARYYTLTGDAVAGCAAWTEVARVAVPGSELAASAEMWLGRCRRGTLPPAPSGPRDALP